MKVQLLPIEPITNGLVPYPSKTQSPFFKAIETTKVDSHRILKVKITLNKPA
ncbi:hypothetical protein J3U66_12045 [Gilliamella sp. B2969]|uniref:hypothetical protein n=1 Tax=Gilliamella sp. B2969 TaxID=2818021 RepID=UPI00226A6C11|nr:hypothetical protein [Gilliamella sp. B2969]MCX8731109.1 hypothetical protein [Gilliamella sp. B2969]